MSRRVINQIDISPISEAMVGRDRPTSNVWCAPIRTLHQAAQSLSLIEVVSIGTGPACLFGKTYHIISLLSKIGFLISKSISY